MRGSLQDNEVRGLPANNETTPSPLDAFSFSCEPCAHTCTTSLAWSRQQRYYGIQTMAEEPPSDSEYESEEIEKVEEDRERYLHFSRVVMGIKPNSTYRKKLKAVKARKKQKNKDQASHSLLERTIQSDEMIITAQVNCPCHEGCKADHGAFYIAQTISKRCGRLDRVNVKEDTGSGPNWISKSDASELALPIHKMTVPEKYKTHNGEEFEATHRVSMTLVGRADKSCHDDFLVAPDRFPVDALILGRQFVRKWGHPFALFDRNEGDEILLVVQNKVSVSGALLCTLALANRP
ncbi:hypothetical protein CC78DRAFT_207796 [Lojkania enalia]|uniref:Uncharacterized protein n=1 Tax=Lojkania enalia TaxID=147567 RepID=A0A9P4N6U2_9PLEO|nr:hypothetical protein CC78DRAFT_207796 [Didymosphaeria enalia]